MIPLAEIVRFLPSGASFRKIGAMGMKEIVIDRPAPIGDAGPGNVSFCGSTARNPSDLLSGARAALIIIDRSITFDESKLVANGVQAIVLSDNARLDFIRLMDRFFAPRRPAGIHATAVIDPSAVIDPDVSIGPLCTVGKNVRIGEGSILYSGVHIYDGVQVGHHVTIHAGTVIGADGFGYERNEEGALEKFPHVGGVVIEDDVEIGANACIDRGSLGDTRICRGARIDNLVHIAHNVHVGRHAVVIADAMVGGSTRIGDYAWIAPSACLRERITIGARATVGLGSIVTRDVPEGQTVAGAPAREMSEYRRLLSRWKSDTAPPE